MLEELQRRNYSAVITRNYLRVVSDFAKYLRLINAAGTLFRRTLLMTLYGTGMRRAELARLKVSDIDSQRMIIRVVAGKGGKDRDLPLSPAQLGILREYWRGRKPKLYLFPTNTSTSSESISMTGLRSR